MKTVSRKSSKRSNALLALITDSIRLGMLINQIVNCFLENILSFDKNALFGFSKIHSNCVLRLSAFHRSMEFIFGLIDGQSTSTNPKQCSTYLVTWDRALSCIKCPFMNIPRIGSKSVRPSKKFLHRTLFIHQKMGCPEKY